MRNDMADENAFFPALCKFRPVSCDRCIKIYQPALHQDQHAPRQKPLGAGKDDLQGVLLPWSARRRVAAPNVDNGSARMYRSERRAYVASLGEIPLKLLRNGFEAGPDMALYDPI